MFKIVLIVALIAFVPSEGHLKKLLLKKAIAKQVLPSALTRTLPPVKNVLPFLGSIGGTGLGAIIGGDASVVPTSADSEDDSAKINQGPVGANSTEVPAMPSEMPSGIVQCTADKPCPPVHLVPIYILYPIQSGYYYPYQYYPYYPYPDYYSSLEHRTTSQLPSPILTTW